MESGFKFPEFDFKPSFKYPSYSTVESPFRSISCGSLVDDFYSNLIDWSGEYIFYCEENKIFQYNFYNDSSNLIFNEESSSICSIKYLNQNNSLVLGCSSGSLIFLDLNTLKNSKYMAHRGRISTMEILEHRIITGSRDRKVKIIDARIRNPERCYNFHTQEICGVSTNKDGRFLSTGGNDNKIFVIDFRKDDSFYMRMDDHKAAVKALSWSPLNATRFISGGGTADKTLKSWDIKFDEPLQESVSFESQVCNLKWLRNNKILSTFGYSNDDIKLLDGFKIEKKFSGHKNRVIHFAVNDDEELFASGSGDSEIKIWNIEEKSMEIMHR